MWVFYFVKILYVMITSMKKILFAFLSLLISVPIIASAQNADVDPQGSSTCVTIQNNLRYRTTDAQTGGDVSDLQDFLQASGYLKASPSGYMGLLTVKSVKAFQSDNGISPTGYVGPLTRAKIQTVSCAGANTNSTSNSNNQNSDTVTNGCTSGAVFSTTTGARCESTSSTINSDSKITIHLNSALATSEKTFDPGSTLITYRVTTESTGSNVASVALAVYCPAGVTANILGEDVPRCNKSVAMQKMDGPGGYVLTLLFKNTTQQSQLIGSMATAYNGSNQAIGSDKDALNIPGVASVSSTNDAIKNAKMVVYIPASGSTLQVGGTYNITWSETPSSSNTVYTIRDYVNQNVITTISRSQAGCSASDMCRYSWTPTQTSLNNYVAVSDYTNSVYGQSGTFSVVSSVDQSKIPAISSIDPSSAAGNEKIFINGSNFTADTVVNLSQNGHIVTTSANPAVQQVDGAISRQLVYVIGSVLAANLTPGTYSLNVSNSQGISNSVNFVFKGNTSQTSPSLTITTPNGGENLTINSPYTIRWNSKNVDGDVAILLVNSNGVGCSIGTVSAMSQGFTYIPVINSCLTATGKYKLHIAKLSSAGGYDFNVEDFSDGDFSIVNSTNQTNSTACSQTNGTYRSPVNNTTSDGNPLVSFVSPSGGEKLCVGKNYRITWDSTNVDKVSLGYSFGEGSLNWFQGNAANNIPNTGSYDWNVNIGNTTNTNLKLYIIGYHTGVGSKASYSNSVTVSQ